MVLRVASRRSRRPADQKPRRGAVVVAAPRARPWREHEAHDSLQRVGSNVGYRRTAVSRGHSRREVSWKVLAAREPVEGPNGGRPDWVAKCTNTK